MSDLLDTRIAALLADPQWQGHPLHDALAELYRRYGEHAHALERLTRIADRYQSAERERGMGYADRYERQLRQLTRLLRISDRYQKSLQELNDELREQSERDELTGLYNRRYMYCRIEAELQRLARGGEPFCIALGDVDHFKRINDGWGHGAGDEALRLVACTLEGRIRASDLCARWGGEEFLLLMPQTALAGALTLVESLRVALKALAPAPDGALPAMTMSFGVAQALAGQTLTQLLAGADRAMYAAKRAGRDRVAVDA